MNFIKEFWCHLVHGVFYNRHGYVKMRYYTTGERTLIMHCRKCGRVWKTRALEETRP